MAWINLEYLVNGDSLCKHHYCPKKCVANIGFGLAHSEMIFTYSQGELGRWNGVSPNMFGLLVQIRFLRSQNLLEIIIAYIVYQYIVIVPPKKSPKFLLYGF